MSKQSDHPIASRVSPVGAAALDTLRANAQQPRAFGVLASRIGRWMCVTLIALTVAACAALPNKELEHGFDVRNVGTQPVSDAIVRYGDFVRAFCDRGIPCRKGYATFYGVNMPIQDSFTVTWKTAHGQDQRAFVPVRERLVDATRFRRLLLRFDGGSLTVLQGSYHREAGLPGWEEAPLYP